MCVLCWVLFGFYAGFYLVLCWFYVGFILGFVRVLCVFSLVRCGSISGFIWDLFVYYLDVMLDSMLGSMLGFVWALFGFYLCFIFGYSGFYFVYVLVLF